MLLASSVRGNVLLDRTRVRAQRTFFTPSKTFFLSWPRDGSSYGCVSTFRTSLYDSLRQCIPWPLSPCCNLRARTRSRTRARISEDLRSDDLARGAVRSAIRCNPGWLSGRTADFRFVPTRLSIEEGFCNFENGVRAHSFTWNLNKMSSSIGQRTLTIHNWGQNTFCERVRLWDKEIFRLFSYKIKNLKILFKPKHICYFCLFLREICLKNSNATARLHTGLDGVLYNNTTVLFVQYTTLYYRCLHTIS